MTFKTQKPQGNPLHERALATPTLLTDDDNEDDGANHSQDDHHLGMRGRLSETDQDTPFTPLLPILPPASTLTLRFFHQYLRLSLAALVSNWEAHLEGVGTVVQLRQLLVPLQDLVYVHPHDVHHLGEGPQGRGVCAKAHLKGHSSTHHELTQGTGIPMWPG